MSSKFTNKWTDTGKRSIRSIIRAKTPLKQKIELSVRRVETQVQYLDGALNRLADRDKSIFAKVVDAYSNREIQRANVFANELAELRRMAGFMMNAKLALERVVLRLRTVTQLGDAVVTLAPATKVLQSVSKGVGGILPNAEQELGEVGMMLNEIMVEAGQTTGISPDFDLASEDARKIMEEAAMVAEERMKEKFPELPALRASEETAGEYEYTQY